MVNRSVMPFGAVRPLTEGERAALSLGLDNALAESGVDPLIVARPSIPALIAAFWRGRPPVMVLGRRIFWPGALEDFSQGPPRAMSVLQHELQHTRREPVADEGGGDRGRRADGLQRHAEAVVDEPGAQLQRSGSQRGGGDRGQAQRRRLEGVDTEGDGQRHEEDSAADAAQRADR